jgi:hypothetical protein
MVITEVGGTLVITEKEVMGGGEEADGVEIEAEPPSRD